MKYNPICYLLLLGLIVSDLQSAGVQGNTVSNCAFREVFMKTKVIFYTALTFF